MKIYLLQEDYECAIPFSQNEDDIEKHHDVLFVADTLEKVFAKRAELLEENKEMVLLYAEKLSEDDFLVLCADTESGEVTELDC